MIPIDKVRDLIQRHSLLEILESSHLKNPFYQLKSKKIRDTIMLSIEELPDKQKLVLSLYYYEDRNLREIGQILNVTESRISQLHTQAVEILRERLEAILIE